MSELENTPSDVPFDGKVIEISGVTYRFQRVPTGRQVWEDSARQLIDEYHSLRTWFSHHTENVGPGPGWDYRFGLSHLKPEEMTRRYGHVFTDTEISSPDEMPDDIPYYELLPFEDDASSLTTEPQK